MENKLLILSHKKNDVHLKPLTFESSFNFRQCLLLHLLNGLLDCTFVTDWCPEHTQCPFLDVLRKVRFHFCKKRLEIKSKLERVWRFWGVFNQFLPCSSPLILELAASSKALLFPAPLVVPHVSAILDCLVSLPTMSYTYIPRKQLFVRVVQRQLTNTGDNEMLKGRGRKF